jgi:microcystin-dependent protein
MAYQFQYVPTSGDLSGAAFEKQTERAINEIGWRADEIQEIAEGAVTTSENALATALAATETADAANSAAQEASAEAQDAMNAATDAGNIANQARGTANDAFDKAAQAETTADTAKSSADQATSTAATAQETAEEASQTANNASGNADLAIQIANEARGVYTAGNGAIDISSDYKISLRLDQTGENPLTVTENGLSLTGSGIPRGGVILWAGAVADVPTGWALCDGSNGTPDLRDRFVVGAGNSYAQWATGGAANVTPAGSVSNTTAGGTVGDTTLAEWQMPYHNHGVLAQSNPGWGSSGGTTTIFGNGSALPATDYRGSNGAHNHGFTGTAHGHTFTGTQHGNIPPYYALAYIMKL